MFGGFFDMDKPFWRWVGKIPDIVGLSFCWYICSIPLITIIPASCALFDAVSRTLMMDDKGCYKRFFRSFVRELKQGIPLSILWIIITIIAFFGNQILNAGIEFSSLFSTFSALHLVMMITMVGYLGWLIPLQSRYNNSFLGLHINALKFFLGRLPSSGLMILTSVGLVLLAIIHPYTYCLLVFVPGVIAILHSLSVEKAFQIAFPQDYEDGLPVYTEQERIAIRAIKKAKQEEAQNAEEE